jgi:hypothetical protein
MNEGLLAVSCSRSGATSICMIFCICSISENNSKEYLSTGVSGLQSFLHNSFQTEGFLHSFLKNLDVFVKEMRETPSCSISGIAYFKI